MMKRRNILAFLCICLSLNVSYGSEVIKVAGSGGMIPLVTELAKSYYSENNNALLLVRQQSIQSLGGIIGVADGELGIGMINRPLKEEEKGLGLEVFEIARAGVVIGVNKQIILDAISSKDLCRIYEGRMILWSEIGGGSGQILALTKPETDSTKEMIRKSISCFKDIKESEKIVPIKTSGEMAAVLANTKSIGFTDSVSVDASRGAIKSLKLDGIAPSPENIRSGQYRLVQSYRLVTKGAPKGSIKDFIEFVKGSKGQKIIEAMNAVPVQ
jgi:phosphate transport system substrate-binding protein